MLNIDAIQKRTDPLVFAYLTRWQMVETVARDVPRLISEIRQLREAVELILPLAQAYAHQTGVESSNRYCSLAQDTIETQGEPNG